MTEQILEPPQTVKYAGANWLLQNQCELSSFGIAVANILGQVNCGIYHIGGSVLRDRKIWRNEHEIKLSVAERFATFDGLDLTFLMFCCHAAGISAELRAIPSAGYIQMVFSRFTWPANWSKPDLPDFEQCASFLLQNNANPIVEEFPGQVVAKYQKSLSYILLWQIVGWAHQSATRAEIFNTGNILSLRLSRRQRSGGLSERHPTIEQAKASLKPYIEIDYSSIN
jgi:hypothetical protein